MPTKENNLFAGYGALLRVFFGEYRTADLACSSLAVVTFRFVLCWITPVSFLLIYSCVLAHSAMRGLYTSLPASVCVCVWACTSVCTCLSLRHSAPCRLLLFLCCGILSDTLSSVAHFHVVSVRHASRCTQTYIYIYISVAACGILVCRSPGVPLTLSTKQQQKSVASNGGTDPKL